MTGTSPGRAAFEAYAAAYVGAPLLPWEQQPAMVCEAWRAAADAAVMYAPVFCDRFTVLPDSGITELHCSSHVPEAKTWQVGYHPSLDVLIEQAHAHNLAEHGDAA